MPSRLDTCRVRLTDVFCAPKGGFLEVCGLAGAGKTQVLLDASCRIALSAEARVIFIDTEGGFDARRFWGIALGSTGNRQAAARVLDRVFVYRVFDALELQFLVCELLDQLRDPAGPQPFSALIVDSVAFPFRSDARRLKDCCGLGLQRSEVTQNTGPKRSVDKGLRRRQWECSVDEVSNILQARSSALRSFGKCLQEIARHGVIVMASNHLTESQDGLVPTLGQSWQTQVARRILLERVEGIGQRQATVMIAAAGDTLRDGLAVGFRIIEAGVQGDDEVGSDDANNDDISEVDDAMDYDTASDKCSSDESSHEEPILDNTQNASPEMAKPALVLSHTKNTIGLTWPPPWWTSRPEVKPITASSLLRVCKSSQHIMPTVELFLKGLVTPGFQGILEVCGEAGTGKTQFCLHTVAAVLASAALDSSKWSKPSCALYVYNEHIPVVRLREMATSRARATSIASSTTLDDAVLDSVFLQQVNTPYEFYTWLCLKLPTYLQHASVKIIVVDSITAMFRNVDLDLQARSSQFFSLAALLKRVSCEHMIPVLVTNHVTADFDVGNGSNFDWAKPALGHAWSSCVSHRISLHRTDRSHMRHNTGAQHVKEVLPLGVRTGAPGTHVTRFARVEFSSALPEDAAVFHIGAEGFH